MTKYGLAGLTILGSVCAVLFTLGTSTPAKADNWRVGINSHGGISIHLNTRDRHYRKHRHGPRHYRGRRHIRGFAIAPVRRYARPHRAYRARACESAWKHDYWRGRRAKVGGLMCYDRRGRGYIVDGSRYLIGYY